MSPTSSRPPSRTHDHGHDGHDGHDHAHDHGHDGHNHAAHGHGHGGHGHSHAPRDFGFAFALGTALNLGFVVVEAVFGVLSNSMALLADAGHNLSDVLGLLIAWGAATLARRVPTARYTYGLRGTSILAALFNALILLVGVGGIAWEAIRRFSDPQPVASGTVMIVAAIGIAINGATALLFLRGRHDDLNIRGAFLHMAADAAISAGVVVAAAAMALGGGAWIDPATSLAIVVIIVWGTWGLLRDSVAMSLQAVPAGIDPAAVRIYLERLDGVARIHDLHIWPMSTTETALTCHLVMPDGQPGDGFSAVVARELAVRFRIGHTTLQIERGQDGCVLEPDHVV
jgi:cobalt-zinc-cadmium efflux system protein